MHVCDDMHSTGYMSCFDRLCVVKYYVENPSRYEMAQVLVFVCGVCASSICKSWGFLETNHQGLDIIYLFHSFDFFSISYGVLGRACQLWLGLLMSLFCHLVVELYWFQELLSSSADEQSTQWDVCPCYCLTRVFKIFLRIYFQQVKNIFSYEDYLFTGFIS